MNTLDQIFTFPTGTNCLGLAGRIIKVGKFFSGTGQSQGKPLPWSFQDIELDDGHTQLVVCLDKRQELAADWVGAYVEFHPGEHQGKPCGIIAEDHTRKPSTRDPNPQPYRRVRITPSARGPEEIEGAGPPPAQHRRSAADAVDDYQRAQRGGPPPQQRSQQPTQGRPGPPPAQGAQPRQNAPQGARQGPPPAAQGTQGTQGQRPASPAQAPASADLSAKALKKLRYTVARVAAVKAMCYDAAVMNAHRHFETHGVKISQEGVGAESNSLFIDTMRHMDHSDFPLLPYLLSEYKGKPLVALYDEQRKPFPVNEFKPVERTQEEKDAEYHRLRQATQSAPAPAPTAQDEDAYAPIPEEEPAGDNWRTGLDGDDIPF